MGDLKYKEVELKFPLLNYKELKEKLESTAKLEEKNDFQKDTYYDLPHRSFLIKRPISEWLRLRKSNRGFSLNYKKWHNESENEAVSCDEFETKVEDVVALKKLFKNLDFKELVVVEKIRSVWDYENTEIAIDEVKRLGNFIEIEAKGNFSDIEGAKKHLYSVLMKIGAKVGEQDFEGYPYLLLKKNKLL
ncbi:MAG: class IV adenylate cyclase [archaeon]